MMGMWESNATQVSTLYPSITLHRQLCLFLPPVDENYRNGHIRLVGGRHNWEGRVEMFWNKTWGAISSHNWNTSEAQVACRQLGHESHGELN